MLRWILPILLVSHLPLRAQQLDLTVVEKWLARHQGARALHLEFDQTRRLAALKKPISTKGRMWLDFATRRFRWQSGDPPKTIVISNGRQILIAQPQRQRVEYKSVGARGSSGPASLAALAEGFPKSLTEFQRKYRILSIAPDSRFHRVRTQPLRGPAAKGIAQLTFFIDRNDFILRGYLAALKDGSTARYDFTTIIRNPDFAPDLFAFDHTGYQVVKESP